VRQIGVTVQSYYRWRKDPVGPKGDEYLGSGGDRGAPGWSEDAAFHQKQYWCPAFTTGQRTRNLIPVNVTTPFGAVAA